MKKTCDIPPIPFYFVRHGQTDWNKENKVMGQTDIPLNAVGIQQAHAAAQNIAHLEVSKIVSSPLQRAKQTAEIIAATLKKPVAVIEELIQNDLGMLEGRNKTELLYGTSIGDLIERWKMGSDIEGVERWSDFVARITVGLNAALAGAVGEKPMVIVAHKPVLWALLHILNAQVVDTNAKNCGVYFFSPLGLGSNAWTVHVLDE